MAVPDSYAGSEDIETFEIYVSRILDWLEFHNLLRPGTEPDQVLFIGHRLTGEAAEWFYHTVQNNTEGSDEWDLISVVKGMQERFIPTLSHNKAVHLFHSAKQEKKTVQELMNSLKKYASRMIEQPDSYTFRRVFLAALEPHIMQAVIKRGKTAEFSDITDIYEEALRYDEATRYNVGMRKQAGDITKTPTKKPEEPKISSQGTGKIPFKSHNKGNANHVRFVPKQPQHQGTFKTYNLRSQSRPKEAGTSTATSGNAQKPTQTTGGNPSTSNTAGNPTNWTCFGCGKTGHTRNYCPLFRNKTQASRVRIEDAQEDRASSEEGPENQDQEEEAMDEDYVPEEEEGDQLGHWYSSDDYEFDEDQGMAGPSEEPSVGTRAIQYPQYEERRESILNNNSATVRVAAGTKETPQPVYDHRARRKERPRPPRGHLENRVLTLYMNVGGILAHCLLDSGCEGVMISADYARAARMPIKPLDKPVALQLACQGSKSMINHGVTTAIDIAEQHVNEYFDVANVDYYDVILGVPFLRRFNFELDFALDEIRVGNKTYKTGDTVSPNETISGKRKPLMKLRESE